MTVRVGGTGGSLSLSSPLQETVSKPSKRKEVNKRISIKKIRGELFCSQNYAFLRIDDGWKVDLVINKTAGVVCPAVLKL